MGHIFISYSHRDTAYAHALAAKLQEMGFETWIDERLDYGSQWPHELQKQLDSCSAFVLIMSSHSYASEWVQSELQRAKRKLKPVFPLLLEGDEPWLSVESTQYYDVRGGKFPDTKFYSALERVMGASQAEAGPVSRLPDADKAIESKPLVRRQKSNTGIFVGIGVVVVFLILGLAVLVPLIWPSSSGGTESEPPPIDTQTSTLPAAPADTSVGPTTVPTIAISNELDNAADFIDPKGVPMRFVAAGNFIMGSNESTYPEEKPVHTVYLDEFYIDKYEVTNDLYKACVEDGACRPPQKTSSFTRDGYYGDSESDHYPVVYVEWEDADTYCKWRGTGLSLPTEAQWEKAARGTDGRSYPWGNDIDLDRANFRDTVGDTSAVGSYEKGKSLYGLYDMAGNVWEWVADWFSNSYYLDAPLTNPTGPASGQYHVLRGGSWHDDELTIRTFTRGWNQVEYFYNVDFGFRCAMDGTP